MGSGLNIPAPPMDGKDAMEYSEGYAGRRLEVPVQGRRGSARQIRRGNLKAHGTQRPRPMRIRRRHADKKSSWRVHGRPYRKPTQVGR